MNFPVFHLDGLGNPVLIALIAITHVIINHPIAVGIFPIIVLMEWWGRHRRSPGWDRLAWKILFLVFLITTTVGALTGVGIWFSTALVNPDAIGSLIRVFFWAWFIEWIVFVLEVSFIMAYFLTWKPWSRRTEPFDLNLGPVGRLRPDPKAAHIAFGALLAVFSFLTMAIIVAILGFMMDTGRWGEDQRFFSGALNPLYLPQLAFRAAFALASAGLLVLALIPFFTKKDDPVRPRATRAVSGWVLFWLPLTLAGGLLYWYMVPRSMAGNLDVALTTQDFTDWRQNVLWMMAISGGVILLVSLWGLAKPDWLPRVALIVPIVLAIGLLGYFERVREFIRKPYVIQGYLYANGLRVQDYPLYRDEGILKHATWVSTHEVTQENRLEAGRNVFLLACSRCHTTDSVFGVRGRLERLYGRDEPWDAQTLKSFIAAMHNARPFMPPFPGNEPELDALALYLTTLRENPPAEMPAINAAELTVAEAENRETPKP